MVIIILQVFVLVYPDSLNVVVFGIVVLVLGGVEMGVGAVVDPDGEVFGGLVVTQTESLLLFLV